MTDQQRVTDEQLTKLARQPWLAYQSDTVLDLITDVRASHDIRAALTGAAESHGERPPGPGRPVGPVQDAVRIAGAILAWCADERAEPVILGSLSSDLTRLCESWGQGAPDA